MTVEDEPINPQKDYNLTTNEVFRLISRGHDTTTKLMKQIDATYYVLKNRLKKLRKKGIIKRYKIKENATVYHYIIKTGEFT